MSSFPTTWRAETHGTYKLFFNSLFYATAR